MTGKMNRGSISRKGRKIFTVSEDVKIYQFWLKNIDHLSVTAMATKLAKQLKRSSESVRDRIRRYIARLNTEEVGSMLNMHEVRYP